MNTIGQIGKGPGEYQAATDLLVNEGRVEILAASREASVLCYTKEGGFIKNLEGKIPKFTSSFAIHPLSGEYFFYSQYNAHKVIRMSPDGHETDSLLPCSQANRLNIYYDAFSVIPNQGLLLQETGYNKIWSYEQSAFREAYSLDLGSYKLEPDEKDEERLFKAMSETGMWNMRFCLENADYLYLMIMFIPPAAESIDGVKIYHLIYDKKKSVTYRIGEGELREQIQFAFDLTEDNKLYLIGSPIDLSELDQWNDWVRKRNMEFKEEDNPVVLFVDIDELI
jgi:hypothetical protein